jgi:hypothetical protein
MKLMGLDDERGLITVYEVPRVRRELMPHLLNEIRWAVQPHSGISAQANPQEMVETCEVIHVRMRNEDIAQPQELARGQSRDIANVEQQRTPLELQIEIKAWIAEGAIDELGVEDRAHQEWGDGVTG